MNFTDIASKTYGEPTFEWRPNKFPYNCFLFFFTEDFFFFFCF